MQTTLLAANRIADMRISFGGAADADIPVGIARLGSILRKLV